LLLSERPETNHHNYQQAAQRNRCWFRYS
jgi:hypothetical protein